MTEALIVAGVVGSLVLVSYLVEAMRSPPARPEQLAWAPDIPIRYLTVGGVRVRYIVAGQGPPVVLLHTLRTQLDLFQKVIPDLISDFTVYAVDYPGHGWSDIPAADYSPEFFTRFTAGFFEALNLRSVLVAGVSIGASIPLLMAAEGNPRIRGIVSFNPYDYGRRGVERANLVARILFTAAAIPLVGETVMRLRNRIVEGKVVDGAVAVRSAVPPAFREALFRVGERPGHYQAFLSLIRHMPLWRKAHEQYHRIDVPVLLVYGDQDWSTPAERDRTLQQIPNARMVTVKDGGHFLPLDQPAAVVEQIRAFAGELQRAPASV
jgi:pimeloyl-ACP methyl ester carboxylesterase